MDGMGWDGRPPCEAPCGPHPFREPCWAQWLPAMTHASTVTVISITDPPTPSGRRRHSDLCAIELLAAARRRDGPCAGDAAPRRTLAPGVHAQREGGPACVRRRRAMAGHRGGAGTLRDSAPSRPSIDRTATREEAWSRFLLLLRPWLRVWLPLAGAPSRCGPVIRRPSRWSQFLPEACRRLSDERRCRSRRCGRRGRTSTAQ